jgi:two-component system, OmpR family, response regulator VanR
MSENLYNLLYVEDESEVRRNYVDYLQRFFHKVYEASNAKVAFDIYKRERPEVLLIDINLQGNKSGIEFLQEIRENDHATKAIMLTAQSDVETLLNATELKLTKYLVKPVSRSDLQEAITLAKEELKNYTVQANSIIEMKESYYWESENQKLLYENKECPLTKKETELMSLLLSNVNKTFSADDIIYELWYDTDEPRENSLKTLIKNLRRKLPKDSIKNIFGVGYTIEL